jgi:hypothetical protein
MRRTRDRSAELALGLALAVMFVVGPVGLSPLGAWKRLIGAVEVNTTSNRGYQHKPVRFLTESGNRWGTEGFSDRRSAYHVLFFHPGQDLETLNWDNDVVGKSRYSSLLHTVTIGDRRYWLQQGNLFVVRFGDDGEPRVTQLRASFHEVPSDIFSYFRLEEAFMEATRGDAEVQFALGDLYNYPPKAKRRCPPRDLDPTRSL